MNPYPQPAEHCLHLEQIPDNVVNMASWSHIFQNIWQTIFMFHEELLLKTEVYMYTLNKRKNKIVDFTVVCYISCHDHRKLYFRLWFCHKWKMSFSLFTWWNIYGVTLKSTVTLSVFHLLRHRKIQFKLCISCSLRKNWCINTRKYSHVSYVLVTNVYLALSGITCWLSLVVRERGRKRAVCSKKIYPARHRYVSGELKTNLDKFWSFAG